jgi:hypothetical protein
VKLLLDECVDRRLARAIHGHESVTVVDAGWGGFHNGALLAQAAAHRFDAFITVDRNLAFQQHLDDLPLAVFILRARTNRLSDLLPLVPELLDALNSFTKREVTWIGH